MPLVLLSTTLLQLGMLGPLSAQDASASPSVDRPAWSLELGALAANALGGGIAGGLSSYLRGGSFKSGFARGVLGGSVGYVGKRIAVADFGGAGLLGREVAALGSSMTSNAGRNTGIFESLTFPIRPLRIQTPRRGGGSFSLSVDLVDVAWLAYAVGQRDLTLDWSRTFSSGMPIFVTRGGLRVNGDLANGLTRDGLIILSRYPDRAPPDVFTHERVHVLQVDQLKAVFGYPLEAWLWRTARPSHGGVPGWIRFGRRKINRPPSGTGAERHHGQREKRHANPRPRLT
jgi:hypothetical protein